MSSTLIEEEEEIETVEKLNNGGGGFGQLPPDFGGGGGGENVRSFNTYETGVWVLIIPIVMLFLGLTSSLIVRKGTSGDWIPIQVPQILGFNTILLLISSGTLEKARHSLKNGRIAEMRPWLWLTNFLGLGFVAGQLIAWGQLAAQGVFLASNPSNSFFYVLTAAHGAHLLGGMAALLFLTLKLVRNQLGVRQQGGIKAVAIYWHFIGILWVYLLFLLIFWR